MSERVPVWTMVILGTLVLSIALLSTPISAFQSGGTTTLPGAVVPTGGVHVVAAKDLQAIPTKLGNWTQTHVWPWDSLAARLNADLLISRDYRRAGQPMPVNFVLIQSDHPASFHSPEVCFRVQGFTVLDDYRGDVLVHVNQSLWQNAVRAHLTRLGEAPELADKAAFLAPDLNATRLVVERPLPGGSTERLLTLSFFITREHGRVADEITWIRAEMPVRIGSNLTAEQAHLADLLAEATPSIFEPTYSIETPVEDHRLVAEWIADKVIE